MTAATIGAHHALIRFAGFTPLPGSRRGTLQRWEDHSDAVTCVRFSESGDVRIVRTAKGFRARHVVRCASWVYASDVEREVRTWVEDYLPSLQHAYETCNRHAEGISHDAPNGAA